MDESPNNLRLVLLYLEATDFLDDIDLVNNRDDG